MQPAELVTVKLYVPAVKPDIVLVDPDPEIAPGLIVHVPDGKLLNATLPVAIEQLGCVIVPTIGAEGIAGCVLITIFAEKAEVHPAEFVTV